MAATKDQVFVCSYCDQALKFESEQAGKSFNCPNCKKRVWVYANRNQVIDSALSSRWYFKRPRFLLPDETIGPIPDDQFLAVIDSPDSERIIAVRSPEFTKENWIDLADVKVELVRARVEQRLAEQRRRARIERKRQEANAKNRQTLMQAIKTAVSDGTVTLNERSKLFTFAEKAGIPGNEVESLLKSESEKLLQNVIEECLSDGLLEPHEKQRIGDLATGLGLCLVFSREQERRIKLCDFAWKLVSDNYLPQQLEIGSVQLAANERPLAVCEGNWNEIVKLKRPSGIPLGDDHYLKEVTQGTCVLTDKKLYIAGAFASKKITLSSVINATWYKDGLFCNRSSGKSVFVQPTALNDDWFQFAMIAQYVVSRQPVLGIEPRATFIPEYIEAELVDEKGSSAVSGFQVPSEPRFTFRVVGDHIGNRAAFISQLRPGDPLSLRREPSNPVDTNAVMVLDTRGNLLGYLKREVAAWFAPILDGGRRYTCNVHRKLDYGGLILGVYEL